MTLEHCRTEKRKHNVAQIATKSDNEVVAARCRDEHLVLGNIRIALYLSASSGINNRILPSLQRGNVKVAVETSSSLDSDMIAVLWKNISHCILMMW